MQFADGHWPAKLDSRDRRTQDYLQWRGAMLAELYLPEYKLRRLWKENFRPEDLRRNKHWEIWPRMNPAWKPARFKRPRGRMLSAQGVYLAGLRAMRDEFRRRLDYNILLPDVEERTRAAVEALENKIAAMANREAPRRGRRGNTLREGRELLLIWYEDLLSIGKLPVDNPVPSILLWSAARRREGLQEVTQAAVGRFMGEQGAWKRHTAAGSAWDLGTLVEARRRWEAARGAADWFYKGSAWQIGVDNANRGA